MRYILELSEEQAEIIKIALEEYFRLRMNQTWDFADDICFDGFDYFNRNHPSIDSFLNCIRHVCLWDFDRKRKCRNQVG